MAVESDTEKTVKWLGRLVVGGFIIATYNDIRSDHDLNIRHTEELMEHDIRISNLEKRSKQVSVLSFPHEAILPDNELKGKNKSK